MKFYFVFILSIIVANKCSSGFIRLRQKMWNFSEEGNMKFPEIALKYGHPTEEREVFTDDGYILSLYHIPGNTSRPVLLVHGNTPTADCWISRGETSMALTLARRGYDVWAVNLRGSRHSRLHRHLNADTQPERFFNFSFYEQGVFDLPATVDLILRETGQDQLLAIGHSVGTTQLFVMGAERPEYNDKIKLAVSLAPICFLEHFRGLASLIPLFGPILLNFLDFLKIYEFATHDQAAFLARALCLRPAGYAICFELVLFGLCGYDEDGLKPDFTPTLLGHFPGGSSVKTFKHLLQVVRSKNFTKYDYGKKQNLEVYNSTTPPLFDLSKVTMKSAIFAGPEDYLATVADSQRLRDSLPNVVHYQVMPYEKFNHLDFIWGSHMNDNFYPYLFQVLENVT